MEQKTPLVPAPDPDPAPHFSDEELRFTDDELQRIERFKQMYPTNQGAVMHTLWLAQKKFSFLPPEVIRLVADTLDLPYALTYGVATFYTQYFKEKKGKYVLDVCTCFTCQVCGGYDVLHYLEEKLGVKTGQTTEDGLFTIQEAECLGACGSAPMLQVTNGHYVHNLTRDKVDRLLGDLNEDRFPGFISITLPQDEDEMGGNRRTDADAMDTYTAPPEAKTFG